MGAKSSLQCVGTKGIIAAPLIESLLPRCWQAQDILHACELFQSPAGAALVASMGHLQREQGNMEGQVGRVSTAIQIWPGAMELYAEARQILASWIILACFQELNATKPLQHL